MGWTRKKLVVCLVAISAVATISGCDRGASANAAAGRKKPQGTPAFRASPECGTYDGEGCAPVEDRIDMEPPTFSDPTKITNPLFPLDKVGSVVLMGEVDGKPFRSETTVLPGKGVVVLDSGPVEVKVSQYTAYLDGRITEVALDRYAQADDGSVWYLGEDVFDYTDGIISVSEGTWLAGRDGPPAMIMPGDPKVGQVFRPEDIPGIVFEEVTVKEVGKTVDGPFGPIEGAMIAEELHLDGHTSDKTFAPGYGEFFTSSEGDTEALALAVGTDRDKGPEPVALARVVTGAWGLVESARLEDWEAVDATLAAIEKDWKTVSENPTPVRVRDELNAALERLTEAVATQQPGPVTAAAAAVAQPAIDIELRYRPVSYVDVQRFHLHAQRLRIDAAAGDAAGVASELATLEWIRDRVTSALSDEGLARIDDELTRLRTSVSTGNLGASADEAARLASLLRRFTRS